MGRAPYPNTAKACAVAMSGSSGAQEMKAAASAVTAQPAAVILVSRGTPLRQATTLRPSVTCRMRAFSHGDTQQLVQATAKLPA